MTLHATDRKVGSNMRRGRHPLLAVLALALAAMLMLAACADDEDVAEPDDSDVEEPDEPDDDDDDDVAEAEGGFFDGETIEVIIPFGEGGGTDTTGRLVADELANRLEGDVNAQVINPTPAIAGANEWAQREPDGLHMMMGQASSFLPWFMGDTAVDYDLAEHELLWGFPSGTSIYSRVDSGVTSAEDFLEIDEPLLYGGRAGGATAADLPALLGFGLLDAGDQIDIVWGYDGGSEQSLAFEQGETQLNRRHTAQAVIQDGHLFDEGTAVILYTHGEVQDDGTLDRDPALPDVPTIAEIYEGIHGEEPSGEFYDAFLAFTELLMGATYNFWVHGDAPEEAKAEAREALAEMSQDPEFQEAVEEIAGPYEPLYGEALENWMQSFQDLNPDYVQLIQDFVVEEYEAGIE